MNATAPNPAAHASIIHALNSLLDAEQGTVFRDMASLAPYLGGLTAPLRKALTEIAFTSQRHIAELVELIQHQGGEPLPRGVVREEQFMAYLSVKFLLPRMVKSRREIIAKYEQTIAALADAPAQVKSALERHLEQNRADLQSIQK